MAPRTLLRFLATSDPAASLSSSTDFPVSPVIRLACSADFSTGRGGFLQLLSMPLSPCCPYHPAEVSRRVSQLRQSMLPSPKERGLGLRIQDFRGHRWVYLHYGPVTCSPSKMALSIGFRNSVSFLPAIQATGLLTLAPVGLPPTEHASIRWTRTLSSWCRPRSLDRRWHRTSLPAG